MKAKKLSVLIVDDNGLYAKRMAAMLDGHVYIGEINTAANYEEAHRKLKAAEHDLVLLDINLAGSNGINLLKEIKDPAKNRKCEVIMISNNSNSYYEAQCEKLGAKHVLDKTHDFDKVPLLVAAMYN